MYEEKDPKHKSFTDHPNWKGWKVIDKFDLKKEHFFPLDSNEQEEKLRKFIQSSLSRLKTKKTF